MDITGTVALDQNANGVTGEPAGADVTLTRATAGISGTVTVPENARFMLPSSPTTASPMPRRGSRPSPGSTFTERPAKPGNGKPGAGSRDVAPVNGTVTVNVETDGLSEFVVGYGQPPVEETPASTAVSVGEGDTSDCFVHVAGTPRGGYLVAPGVPAGRRRGCMSGVPARPPRPRQSESVGAAAISSSDPNRLPRDISPRPFN